MDRSENGVMEYLKAYIGEELAKQYVEKYVGKYLDELLTGDLLEKAWSESSKKGVFDRFVPNLKDFGMKDGYRRLDIDENTRFKELLEEEKARQEDLKEYHLRTKAYCPKDWRDFK